MLDVVAQQFRATCEFSRLREEARIRLQTLRETADFELSFRRQIAQDVLDKLVRRFHFEELCGSHLPVEQRVDAIEPRFAATIPYFVEWTAEADGFRCELTCFKVLPFAEFRCKRTPHGGVER